MRDGVGKVPVLMLPMSLDIGGAETHVVGLARSLRQRGWPVYVASSGGRRVKDLEDAQIPHFTAPLDSRSPLNMARAYSAVARLVRENNIGLVHAHARIPAWIAEKVCATLHVPLVTTYHWTFVSGAFWNLFTRAGDLTIAVSQDIKDYIVREFGFSPDKITVIPNGIDTDLFAPAAETPLSKGGHSPGPTVLYMSRLNKELSETAISTMEAVFSLKDAYPGIRILVAGDGVSLPEVRAAAARLNSLTGRELAECLGFVLDTPPLIKSSDLVVGMSRVVLEAMSCQKPVIIAGPGGNYGPLKKSMIPLLEEVNFTSRGAPEPATPQNLARDIDGLLKDKALRREIGTIGRSVVLDLHSMNLVAQETEKVYFRLLSSRATRRP